MAGFPTVEGSGSSSAGAATSFETTSSEPWGPTSSPTNDTDAIGADPPGGEPSITFRSADGHQLVLTYHDLVLAALLVTLGLEAWGRMR